MAITTLVCVTLNKITEDMGILRFLAALFVYAALITVAVSTVILEYKAYTRRCEFDKKLFICNNFGIYPMIYGSVGRIIIPIFYLWVVLHWMEMDWKSAFEIIKDPINYLYMAYNYYTYKKFAPLFGKDASFAIKMVFLYPLALKELAFSDAEYLGNPYGLTTAHHRNYGTIWKRDAAGKIVGIKTPSEIDRENGRVQR